MVKYQPFFYKLVDHEIKKITSLNLILLHLQKKIILEMFIAAPTEYLQVSLNKKWILLQLLQRILRVRSFSDFSPV